MTAKAPLPATVKPMLAKLRKDPFTSDEHVFEIKWDGMRTLAFVDDGGYRIHNRRLTSHGARYPELEFLAALPTGTVVDGELVVLEDGKPNFSRMMGREHARDPLKIRALAATTPCTYVVFDLLYRNYEPLLKQPLIERRARLQELIEPHQSGFLMLSDGIVGDGTTFYEHACAQELEGIVAKKLNSRYRPGHRGDSWQKIKRCQELQCVIIGYQVGEGEVRSLVIAAPDDDGQLRCVGKVGSGLDGEIRAQLTPALADLHRDEPLVPNAHDAQWIDPGLYCIVHFLEHTTGGDLRAPVFKELIIDS
ncbi:MAG: non-homologous end-joining DNA ligase [Planctomycetota bacterium]